MDVQPVADANLTVHKSFKYRIYPTREQQIRLDEWLERNRELYNAALEERREAYNRAGKCLTLYDQQKELAAVREGRPEYYALPIEVLRGTLKRLDEAFQAFFRRLKAGETPGYPRFRGKNRFASFTYNQVKVKRVIEGNRVLLPMFGMVKIRLHRPLEGTVKTLTVRRDGDQWYVSFNCAVPAQRLPATQTTVGIDLGVEKFAALSSGETIPNPRYLRRAAKKLKQKQQALSRCQNSSHRRERAKRELRNAHRKVRDQRQDFVHKLSRRLVSEYGSIVLETLQPAKMSRRVKPKPDEIQTRETGQPVYAPNGQASKTGLNEAIRDTGWGLFQRCIIYKAGEAGRIVLFVNPAFTSQTCSGCGAIKKKELAERWHSCPCGVELDRDVNAAVNILRRGIAR